jgi:hypothetical protein
MRARFIWDMVAVLQIQSVMKNRKLFFQLLTVVNAVENTHHTSFPDIDAQILFMRIAMAHQAKAPLNVTQAMNLRHIGSPAMLHRKINDLLQWGMVDLVFEGGNRRTKYLEPTEKAYTIIDEMAYAAAAIYEPIS